MTTTTTITRENFTAAIIQAVAERGEDYVYPEDDKIMDACQYKTENGEPSCIIGLALHLIDPILVPERGSVAGARDILRDIGVTDAALLDAATDAQSVQDNFSPWGYALTAYKNVIAKAEEADAAAKK